MQSLIHAIIVDGGIAFLGSNIAKALQQNEISDIIKASGWASIGIIGLDVIVQISNWFASFGDKVEWFSNFIK